MTWQGGGTLVNAPDHPLRSPKNQMLEMKADQRPKPCEDCDAAWGSSVHDYIKIKFSILPTH